MTSLLVAGPQLTSMGVVAPPEIVPGASRLPVAAWFLCLSFAAGHHGAQRQAHLVKVLELFFFSVNTGIVVYRRCYDSSTLPCPIAHSPYVPARALRDTVTLLPPSFRSGMYWRLLLLLDPCSLSACIRVTGNRTGMGSKLCGWLHSQLSPCFTKLSLSFGQQLMITIVPCLLAGNTQDRHEYYRESRY